MVRLYILKFILSDINITTPLKMYEPSNFILILTPIFYVIVLTNITLTYSVNPSIQCGNFCFKL